MNQGGFIALISTLILSMVLAMLLISTSTYSFFARFDSLGSEFKKTSQALSEACVNIAILKIAQDYNYSLTLPGEEVSIGEDKCTIKSVADDPEDPGTNTKIVTIETLAKFPMENGSWSTNKVQIRVKNPGERTINPPFSSSNVQIISWE